ncbi:nuclear transport factor 2 family protein [Gramella lutea]|uniref:Nuclear transport factor 2 family protein n=1 Tax=Christiangramia lutea TaxID=1607951 RepID=A0A9X1V3S2_9FLAO|nr:DUF4440 domain-containing protein [Christiangramia lutea]MCH4823623.1 nuclear transport factor 2 family protein [Christiangramia lutea]
MRKVVLIIFTILYSGFSFSQVAKDSDLYKELKSRDSLLFDRGFNKCKISEFQDFISNDLEFYHDQAGITTNKEDFLTAVKNNICGNLDVKPIRKLREESLKVFPLYQNAELYGAIQKGIHDFFIKEPNRELYQTGTAKFTHLWIKENNEWILKRVLSYDHKNPE